MRIALLLLVVSMTYSSAVAASLVDLEKTPWLTPKEKIYETLSGGDKNPHPQANEIVMSKNLIRENTIYPCRIFYVFNDGALTKITAAILGPEDRPLTKSESQMLYGDLKKTYRETLGEPEEEDAPCPRAEKVCVRTIWANGKESTMAVIRGWNEKDGEKQEVVNVLYRPRIFSAKLLGQDAVFAQGVQKRFKDTQKERKTLGVISISPADNPKFSEEIIAAYTLEVTPTSLAHAKNEAHTATMAIIDTLISLGVNPGEEHLGIRLWLQSREKGVTGKNLVRLYGAWAYYWQTDQLQWEEAK